MRIARAAELELQDGDVVTETLVPDAHEAAAPERIAYHFARKHGVVLAGESEGRLRVAMRQGADPGALVELRRWLARPFAVEFVAPEEFDRQLG
ncbi:MAG TPA: type II secretion system protein GspE, partial [Allosphingosinicella sp.]